MISALKRSPFIGMPCQTSPSSVKRHFSESQHGLNRSATDFVSFGKNTDTVARAERLINILTTQSRKLDTWGRSYAEDGLSNKLVMSLKDDCYAVETTFPPGKSPQDSYTFKLIHLKDKSGDTKRKEYKLTPAQFDRLSLGLDEDYYRYVRKVYGVNLSDGGVRVLKKLNRYLLNNENLSLFNHHPTQTPADVLNMPKDMDIAFYQGKAGQDAVRPLVLSVSRPGYLAQEIILSPKARILFTLYTEAAINQKLALYRLGLDSPDNFPPAPNLLPKKKVTWEMIEAKRIQLKARLKKALNEAGR